MLCVGVGVSYYEQVHIQLHALLHVRGCVWADVHVHAHVYGVLRSVPLCFASVQKGLVPTTWCRAASAPPIPAWIATLAANQKLPAAFAVCPLSIFSNTSLNLLPSLDCCIKTPPPHSTHSRIVSFVCPTYDMPSVTGLRTHKVWAGKDCQRPPAALQDVKNHSWDANTSLCFHFTTADQLHTHCNAHFILCTSAHNGYS